MHRRFPLSWSASLGYHVDLPTLTMIPGTWLPKILGGVPMPDHAHPITGAPTKTPDGDVCDGDGVHWAVDPRDPRIAALSVECETPDEYTGDDAGDVDLAVLRRMYKGHPRYDRADYAPPKPDKPIPKPRG